MPRTMKTWFPPIWAGAIALAILGFALSEVPWSRDSFNDLGLSRSDLKYGKLQDVVVLKEKTKKIADAYLAGNEAKLKKICGEPFEPAVDYSLTPKMRKLGYRSSFYYYCWDIYLPYSTKAGSHGAYTILIQLSDKARELPDQHDLDRFRVLRTFVIDQNDQVVTTLEDYEGVPKG